MNPHVFIIGFARCGGSWVGRILSEAPDVKYLYEPLFGMTADETMRDSCLSQSLNQWRFCGPLDHAPAEERVLGSALIGSLRFPRLGWKSSGRPVGGMQTRYVVKMIWGCFKAERFARVFSPHIVLLERSALGQISGWEAAQIFRDITPQQAVRRVIECPEFAARFPATVDNARRLLTHDVYVGMAVWWGLLHSVFSSYVRYNKWVLIQYEDLCKAPRRQFKRLFQACGLEFTTQVKKFLASTTRGRGRDRQLSSVSRWSAKMPDVWEHRLSRQAQRTTQRTVEKMGE